MTQPGELTYRRTHKASRELLFDCMTKPEHLSQFWGPDGTTTPLDGITVQLRPGGVFETVMVNITDGSQYTMRAVFLTVERPAKLAWTEPGIEGGMVTTVTFTDLGDGRTEVVTHQTNVPAAFASPEARRGFETSLRRFDQYIRKLTSG
ncbi:MAG TPA: SRPBCC domain-containing protein [Streptosporangiaceae bacterium]|nr:SRPBCC domain-containing protein [Streptosporangiaceae bacterium]